MPNWCENDLAVTGPQDDLEAMLKSFGHVDGDDIVVLDFNKVIPYPEHFRKLDDAAEIENQRIDKMPKEDRIAYFAMNGRPKDGFNQGGYEWCCKNWGAKWNVFENRDVRRSSGRIEATFDTAWAPPFPIIIAASERFPALTFEMRYFEQGVAFQGEFIVKAGEVLKDVEEDYFGNRGG